MSLHSSSLDSAFTSLCSCAASPAAAEDHPHRTLDHHAPADRILRAHAPIPTFGSGLRFWTAQIAARIRFTCCKDGSRFQSVSPFLSQNLAKFLKKKQKLNFHIFREKNSRIFRSKFTSSRTRKSKIFFLEKRILLIFQLLCRLIHVAVKLINM
jgi:hypothetical protein